MDTPDTPSDVAPQAAAGRRRQRSTKPNGPVVAVMLAAGIGALVLGS